VIGPSEPAPREQRELRAPDLVLGRARRHLDEDALDDAVLLAGREHALARLARLAQPHVVDGHVAASFVSGIR
jgi:hypothetical protein